MKRSSGRRYTTQEKQEALDVYRAGGTLKESAEAVGATLESVRSWAKKDGCLRTMSESHKEACRKGRRGHGEAVWDEVVSLYESGMTAAQVDERMGLSKGVAYNILRRLGKVRSESEWRAQAGMTNRQARRKYQVDEQVFGRPLTPDTAWLLGVIYGDGSIVEDRGVRRSLEIAGDEDVCEKARVILGAEAPIRNPKGKTWLLRVSSTNLAESMEGWGVVPRKSSILSWPEGLPVELSSHFLRGIWDADGWVSVKNRRLGIALTARELIQGGIKRCVSYAIGKIVSVSCRVFDNPNHADIYGIQVQGSSAVALGSWMWDDSEEHMRGDRKYKLWLQLKERVTG